MKIIKQGKDLSKEITCQTCGCVFIYQPGEIETQYDQIYNVPEVHWRSHGGRYDPIEIRHRHIVRCPSCKSKCNIDN